MGLQSYYDNFATQPSRWSDPDPRECGCRGRGWFVSELDTVHKCPIHFVGQPDPHDDVDWTEHALLCLTGFFARAKKVLPQPRVAESSCDPDDIPF